MNRDKLEQELPSKDLQFLLGIIHRFPGQRQLSNIHNGFDARSRQPGDERINGEAFVAERSTALSALRLPLAKPLAPALGAALHAMRSLRRPAA